jgi:hypothetical protein
MLITGEFIHSIPLPLVWSLGGCALQRLSMVVWWWLTVRKASGNEDFRTRAQMTFVGHVFSLLSVFMVFLPMFDARLNQMLVGHSSHWTHRASADKVSSGCSPASSPSNSLPRF